MFKHLIIVVFAFSFVTAGCSFQPVVFEGTSMLPALKNGDRILLDKNFGELKRGDIIAFRLPSDTKKIFVKRIIALPNERIDYQEGKVFINGEELNEPYIDSQFNQMKLNLFKKISLLFLKI